MVALQIRDVPDQVRETLAEQAAGRGQSLQAFLLWLVTEQAHRSANLSLLQRFTGRDDGSRISVAQVTEALDRARSEREAELAADTGSGRRAK